MTMTPYLDGAGRNAPARADNRSDSALQARILVVEDDADIASLLGRELRGLGHTVDAVRLAEDALQAARGNDYALMIIDLGLPDGDGLDLVREMRRHAIEVPILMLTARRKVEDRVIGLGCGADDYLAKPFAVSEVRARVSALLRRPSRLRGNRLAIANLVVDCDALEAVVEGHSLPLAFKQFQLLELLVRRKNHMTPKRMIEETLYGFDDEVSANSIEAHVSKLRRALRAAGVGVNIETRRGIGYRLVDLGVVAAN
jgi:DNA-binding response OmpR family regulator